MASIVIAGDVSGTCTLLAANAAGNTVLNLPTTSGTLLASGSSPSFTTITTTSDASISGLTVGKGGGAVDSNTALGATALAANTTGNSNTVIGYAAGNDITTGSRNTIAGRDAGTAITTSADNTAYGAFALSANTTGASNTGIGSYALQANTTASNNTAVGYQAGYSNTTGTLNVAVGYRALYSTTTQNQNVAVGADAFYSNTTGYFGVAVGYRAGESNTTGFNNTVIGRDAGRYITTGSSNTIIGSYDGNQGGLDIRTSSNFIVLSDGSGNPRITVDNNGGTRFANPTPTAPWDATSNNYAWVGSTYPIGAANSDIVLILNRHTNNGVVVEIKKGTSVLGTISHNGTNTAYNTSSDYRLKENIAPMTGALSTVTKLKPCTYTWKESGEASQGFIAHELAEVVPDAVTGEKDAVDADGKIIPQGVDTSYLVATLTAAIQELNAKVEAQAAEIAALKGAN